MGGTLLELVAGDTPVEVDWFVLTSTPERAEETRASAEAFLGAGAGRVRVNTFRDGFLPFQAVEVKEAFEALKAEVSPDVIFTHSRDDSHQDHRFVAELTWNTWRNHAVLEYEIPKYDGDLGPLNAYVEVSEEHVRAKWDLLREHYPSQASRQWFSEDTFRGLMRLRGIEANTSSGFAEGFRARKLRLDFGAASSATGHALELAAANGSR
ncbi:MAG: PIG-L family deacetylase [Dehalococcoidia bacterium]|nr:PIG-L family deacetylase [Dehalococcoidia bacterium]